MKELIKDLFHEATLLVITAMSFSTMFYAFGFDYMNFLKQALIFLSGLWCFLMTARLASSVRDREDAK